MTDRQKKYHNRRIFSGEVYWKMRVE